MSEKILVPVSLESKRIINTRTGETYHQYNIYEGVDRLICIVKSKVLAEFLRDAINEKLDRDNK